MKKIAGVVWYSDEVVYCRALAIFADAFNMPRTYEDWVIGVAKIAKDMKRDGWVLVRAELDPETFPAWCKSRGLKIEAKARGDFGNEAADEYLRTGKGVIIDI